jgi:hypothetical protein
MSQYDSTVAQMVNRHAMLGVQIEIMLAWLRFDRVALKVFREHRDIIIARGPKLGKRVPKCGE